MKRSIRGRWWELWARNSSALICDLELRCSKSNKCSMSVTSISSTAPKILEGQCRQASFSSRERRVHDDMLHTVENVCSECTISLHICVWVPHTYRKSYCPHLSLGVDHTENLMVHWSMRWSKQFKGSFVWSALESPWSQAAGFFFFAPWDKSLVNF